MPCRTYSNQKLFVYEENRSKLTLSNLDQADSVRVKVDGCEITGSTLRCDYLHIAKDVEFYIELKGQDIEHAIDQIKSTISQLSLNPKNQKKKSYIICTRSPLSTTKIQGFKLYFRKHYNSELIVKSSPYKDTY